MSYLTLDSALESVAAGVRQAARVSSFGTGTGGVGVEDLVQDASLHAWKVYQSPVVDKHHPDARAYFWVVGYSRGLSGIHRELRRSRAVPAVLPESPDVATVDASEWIATLIARLRKMGGSFDLQADAIACRALGLSYTEVEDALDLPAWKVRYLLDARGMRRIRRALGVEDG